MELNEKPEKPKMTKEERVLREKEFAYEFWHHTKRRYDAYLNHMVLTEDDATVNIVIGCAVEFFAMMVSSYGYKYLAKEDQRAVLLDTVGKMYDDVKESFETQSPQSAAQAVADLLSKFNINKPTLN